MGFVPAGGGPNQIGNVEDGPVLPDMAEARPPLLSLGHGEAMEQPPGTPPVTHPDGGDVIMYTPITPTRTDAQLERMKSRRTKSKERPPQQ